MQQAEDARGQRLRRSQQQSRGQPSYQQQQQYYQQQSYQNQQQYRDPGDRRQQRPSPHQQREQQDTVGSSSDKSNITCCERFCSCLSTWGIHIVNVFDVVLGVMILVIAFILFANLGDRSSNFMNAWLAYTCLIIGCMLILVSAFGAMGVACSCCRCSAVLSGYLAMGVGLICFILSVIFFAMKPLILEYFERDGESLGLSSYDIKLTETWYMVISIGLFTVSALELMRFLASIKLYELSDKLDNEEYSPLVERGRGEV